MNWKAPALFLSLSLVVLALLWCFAGKEETAVPFNDAPMEPVTLAVAADVHFLAPSLTDHGPAFTRVVTNADGKVTRYSEELTHAFLDQIAAERPDALILAGDLTFNGAKESHEALAEACRSLRESGVRVLVLPGNHDLECAQAARFSGDAWAPAESVSPEEFRALYAAFGYDDALSVDPNSLSYVCALCPGLRLLLVDSNVPGLEDTVPAKSFSWIEAQLQQAAEAGDRVIAVSHQTLLRHNSRFDQGFVITNRERLLALYRKYHVRLNLCGHMHIQHWKTVSGLTEILTGALSVQPCEYGVLSLTAEGGSYETRPVDVSAWARERGIDNPELLDFSAYALEFFRQNTIRQHPALSNALQTALADVNAAYFAGRMDAVTLGEAERRALSGSDAFLKSYLESMLEDLGADFTHVTFSFQE